MTRPMDWLSDEEQRKVLRTRLSLPTLLPKERAIIELRFGLKDGCSRTLEEVGREFGLTRERIRQYEAKALRKMCFAWIPSRWTVKHNSERLIDMSVFKEAA